MKKIIVLLVLFVCILFPVFSSEENPVDQDVETVKEENLNPSGWWNDFWAGSHVTYDLYARSVLLQREGVNFGGGLSLGVKTPRFRFDTYFQGDYFMKPLGGEGGAAALEFDLEGGITLSWKFIEFWNFDTYVGCDIGYYAQFVRTHYQPETFTLGFNGLMIRPKLYTELNIGNWYGLSVAVFFQMPVYPVYSDYRGLGIMFSFV